MGSKLDKQSLRWIYDTVTLKNPTQFKFPMALWTAPILVTLIRDKLDICLSRSSVKRVLRKMGIGAKSPAWRVSFKNSPVVHPRLKEQYPNIKALAKRHKADIYFANEKKISSIKQIEMLLGERIQMPFVFMAGARIGHCMISAVNTKGLIRFMITQQRMGPEIAIEFLQRLIHDAEKPIFLIIEKHIMYKGKEVAAFLASVQDRLRLFFIPIDSSNSLADTSIHKQLARK